MEAAENLVLDLELSLHGELGTFLDLEWLVLQVGLAARLREVDDNGVAAGGLHGQGADDANTGVVRVREILAAAEAEGLLVSL